MSSWTLSRLFRRWPRRLVRRRNSGDSWMTSIVRPVWSTDFFGDDRLHSRLSRLLRSVRLALLNPPSPDTTPVRPPPCPTPLGSEPVVSSQILGTDRLCQ